MKRRRVWTISLPPELEALADALAREEHRTKSELVREALRLYLAQRHRPWAFDAQERLERVGELAELYRQRAGSRRLSERELRAAFRGVRRTHERLRSLDA